jgi:hypothetical protein
VVGIWHPEDLWAARAKSKDIPCTLDWQFLVRDNRLHMGVAMRSNDAWLGFPYDVFAFTCFQRVVAAHLGVDVGLYHHHVIGSMHLYARDEEGARHAIKMRELPHFEHSHSWHLDDTLSSMANAVECERQLRETGASDFSKLSTLGFMARDLVAACATKTVRPPSHFPRPFSGAFNALLSGGPGQQGVEGGGEAH